jgi:hypothetical protein
MTHCSLGNANPPRAPWRGGQFQLHPCAGATCAICAAFSSVGNRPFGVSRLIKFGRCRQQVFPSYVGLPAQHVKRIAAKRVGHSEVSASSNAPFCPVDRRSAHATPRDYFFEASPRLIEGGERAARDGAGAVVEAR